MLAIPLAAGCPGNDHAADDEIGETGANTEETGTDTDDVGLNCGVTASDVSVGPFVGWASIGIELSDSRCPNSAAEFAAQLDPKPDPQDQKIISFTAHLLFPVAQGESLPPGGEYPLLIFQHGNGQEGQYYDHFWNAVVPEGVFVANLDTSMVGGPATRKAWFKCAIEYFGSQWPDPKFLTDNPTWPKNIALDSRLALAGHSISGEAALVAAAELSTDPSRAFGFDLQGLITLAPREQQELAAPIPPSKSIDYLGISGSVDNDVEHAALRVHELAGDDESSLPDPGASKTLVWAYDVHHNAFGGVNDKMPNIAGTDHGVLAGPEMYAKGRAVAVPYVHAFLRRLWLDSTLDSDLALLRGEVLAKEVYNPSWWNYLEASVDGSPVIRMSHVDGCETRRVVLDDFARAPEASLSPSSEDLEIVVTGDLSKVGVLPLDDVPQSHQYTNVLEVAWQAHESGTVTWNLGAIDIAAATHLSFRVANVADITGTDPGPEGACIVDSIHPELEFKVVITDHELGTTTTSVAPLVQDYAAIVYAGDYKAKFCAWANMMSEVVLPIGEACPSHPLSSVRLEFGGSPGGGHVYIDDLELRTRRAVFACP